MAIWDLPPPPSSSRRMRCSTWRPMGLDSQHARCDNGRVQLEVTSVKGKHFYVVKYHGSIVRHGFAKSAAAAKRAARSQAGATSGLSGPLDFVGKLFKKKAKRNPMSQRIYMIRTKSGRLMPASVASMQGARRRRRRRR